MSSDREACGELLYSMYGTRDAAANWESEYSEYLATHGYKKGAACPCHFWNPHTGVKALVHGDDFLAIGTESALKDMIQVVTQKYEAKYELWGGIQIVSPHFVTLKDLFKEMFCIFVETKK